MICSIRSILVWLLVSAVLPGASAAQLVGPDEGSTSGPIRLYGVIAGTTYASFTGTAIAPIVFNDSAAIIRTDPTAVAGPVTGWGFAGGIEAGVAFGTHWRALVDVVLFTRQGSSVVTPPDAHVVLPGTTLDGRLSRIRTEVLLRTLDARAWAAYVLAPYTPATMTLAVGLAEGLYLDSRLRRTIEADTPQRNPWGLPSEHDGRTLTFFDDAIPDHADIELAALGRLSIEVPVAGMFLGVDVIGRLPFTKLSPALSASSLELTVHLTRGQFRGDDSSR